MSKDQAERLLGRFIVMGRAVQAELEQMFRYGVVTFATDAKKGNRISRLYEQLVELTEDARMALPESTLDGGL